MFLKSLQLAGTISRLHTMLLEITCLETAVGLFSKTLVGYPYVTAVFNSPIVRLFTALCKSKMIFSDYADPTVLGRFPIKLPDNRLTEDLINTIFGYLIFLNKQVYTASYRVPEWLQKLT